MEEMAGKSPGKLSQFLPKFYTKNVVNFFIFATYKIIVILALFKIIFCLKKILQYSIKISKL
jgi:hypothetical protein